jgi:hypothetical protein
MRRDKIDWTAAAEDCVFDLAQHSLVLYFIIPGSFAIQIVLCLMVIKLYTIYTILDNAVIRAETQKVYKSILDYS